MKIILALLLAFALPASAATATLSTGASCQYDLATVTPGGGIAVTCSGVIPPQPPDPTPPSACPYPVPVQPQFAWGVLQARQYPGQVAAYPIPEPQFGRIVTILQGQMPVTPPDVVTEFYVSTCPGEMNTFAATCYYKSTIVNNNSMDVYRSSPPAGACSAPAGQQYYLNVRWTYPSCPFGSCGFSLMWVSNW